MGPLLDYEKTMDFYILEDGHVDASPEAIMIASCGKVLAC